LAEQDAADLMQTSLTTASVPPQRSEELSEAMETAIPIAVTTPVADQTAADTEGDGPAATLRPIARPRQ
jgi:hypothetical protein